jgi:hypothetical protein
MPYVLEASDGGLTAERDCNELATHQGTSPATTYAFRFRALLRGDTPKVRLERITR